MKNKQTILLMQFDSLISKALTCEKKYYFRGKTRRSKKEMTFSDLSEKVQQKLYTEDSYFENDFLESITVAKLQSDITNELLYEAIRKLKPKPQKIILLKYWHEMTDEQIGNILNIKRSTVNYNKNIALGKLKEIIERMIEND